MVDESRRLELALGSKIKKIEKNEKESFFVQRRGVYSLKKLNKGEKLNKEDVICLRPYIKNTISPFDINKFFVRLVDYILHVVFHHRVLFLKFHMHFL